MEKTKQCSCYCRHFARILTTLKKGGFFGRTSHFTSIKQIYSAYRDSNAPNLHYYLSTILTYDNAKQLYDECVMCNCCNRHKQNFPMWSQIRYREDDDNENCTNKKRRI